MPSKTSKQQKFMRVELGRKRTNKKTKMSERKLEEYSRKRR